MRTIIRLMRSPSNTGSAGGSTIALALQSMYSVSGSAGTAPLSSTIRVGSRLRT